jgi:17beta-estradiol 17-dehydrogenase / very-long-chain 3-oxoacyl-CoA reductase
MGRNENPSYTSWGFLSGLGLITAASLLYRPVTLLHKLTFKGSPNLPLRYGRDSYCLVTGASDGIGKGFCEAFAKRGMNLVLVSRNKVKTEGVASELAEKYGVKAEVFILDFSSSKEADFKKLKDKVKNLDISILVNNVGLVDGRRLEDLKFNEIRDMISVNCASSAYMTNALVPQMMNRINKSAIIFTTSSLSIKPIPIATMYSSSKVFNHYMAIGLSEEYKDKIDVLSYQPSTVMTKATPDSADNPNACSVEESVEGALQDLGSRRVTHGYYKHELMAWLINWMPENIRLPLSFKVISNLMAKRAAAKELITPAEPAKPQKKPADKKPAVKKAPGKKASKNK